MPSAQEEGSNSTQVEFDMLLPVDDFLKGSMPLTPRGRSKLLKTLAGTILEEIAAIPELKDEGSYFTFKKGMTSFLQHYRWWGVANGSIERPSQSGENQERWDFVDRWARWAIRRKIDHNLAFREGLDDDTPTAAALLSQLSNTTGYIAPQMVNNLYYEFQTMTLQDGEDPAPFWNKLKEVRRKLEAYGQKVNEAGFISRIFSSLGDRYYFTARHMHDHKELTSAMLMSNVTSVYRERKRRNALRAINYALNINSKRTAQNFSPSEIEFPANKRPRSHKCNFCSSMHRGPCFKKDSAQATELWRWYNGDWIDGQQIAVSGKSRGMMRPEEYHRQRGEDHVVVQGLL